MREIRVPPRLWFGFWLCWASFWGASTASAFIVRVVELPHTGVVGALMATWDAFIGFLMVVTWRIAFVNFCHPPGDDDDDAG
jgi:hypothetical protein